MRRGAGSSSRARLLVGFVAFGVTLLGCGPNDDTTDGPDPDPMPECLETLEIPCVPLSEPVYDKLFENTFKTCASTGVSCHGAAGKQGGLVFEDPIESEALLRGSDGNPRVAPGNARCSELMVRLDLADHAWSMPAGGPQRSAAERCSIRMWIQNLMQP